MREATSTTKDIPGETREIFISTNAKNYDEGTIVPATVYDKLAVHRRYDPNALHEKEYQWQITHVSSGFRIPGYYRLKTQARAAAQALQAAGISWGFRSPGNFTVKDKKRAKEVLEQHLER
jgi:hypothetical protein